MQIPFSLSMNINNLFRLILEGKNPKAFPNERHFCFSCLLWIQIIRRMYQKVLGIEIIRGCMKHGELTKFQASVWCSALIGSDISFINCRFQGTMCTSSHGAAACYTKSVPISVYVMHLGVIKVIQYLQIVLFFFFSLEIMSTMSLCPFSSCTT